MIIEPEGGRAKRRSKGTAAARIDVADGSFQRAKPGERPGTKAIAKGRIATFEGVKIDNSFVGISKRWSGPSLEAVTAIERGLTFDALADIDTQLPGALRRIIPRSTLAAQRKKGETLTPAQGERLYQAGKVFGFATTVLGSEDSARRFLMRPHPMLDDRTPLDIALESGAGADLVVNLLGRGAYGGGA